MRRGGRSALTVAALAGVSAAALAVSGPAGAAPANLTWSGAATSPDWSVASNWSGTAPVADGSYGTLHLGGLTKACNQRHPITTCYRTTNDLAGLTVNGIDVNDLAPYRITGDGITIGAGGINANVPNENGSVSEASGGLTSLDLPITLGADQTWVVDDGALSVGSITGAHQLTVDDGASWLMLTKPINVSALDLTGGAGEVVAEESLNGTSGGNVTVANTDLQLIGDTPLQTGPLTTTDDGGVEVGLGVAPETTATVDGNASFTAGSSLGLSLDKPASGSSSPQPGADYSQLSAAGTVALGGASLQLGQGVVDDHKNYQCVDLRSGDVYTLVSAANITGTFHGIPNGHTVRLGLECDGNTHPALTDPTATINYTATTVTATIKSGGHAGDIPQADGRLKISGDPTVGHTLNAKGRWTGTPTTFRYQWDVCGMKTHRCIQSKTHGAKLKLTPSMAGGHVFVFSTASNQYGVAESYGQLRRAIKPAPKK